MLTLTRWNRDLAPELAAFERRVNRMLSDGLSGLDWSSREAAAAAWTPPVDVFEQADAIRILAELPGVKPDNVKISVEGNVLTIAGAKEQVAEERTERVHRYERTYGGFERTFTLPATVDVGAIKADCAHGVLTITLPKVEKAKPRTIEIGVAK